MSKTVQQQAHGVLVIDKPKGCTSHDVVQRVRRVFKTRAVGHAGTLDPLATGVLVVALGEATKLVSYLQASEKVYEVTARFGLGTDTLDMEGEVIETKPVPALSVPLLQQALDGFVGTHPQQVPRYSAVKVEGEPLHRRVRRGEDVEAPVRDATLHEARVLDVAEDRATLWLRCAKGFFVRALVRDVARAIGTVAHVTDLRRVRSGSFSVSEAATLDELSAAAEPHRGLISLIDACRDLHKVELTEAGAADARHGRPIVRDGVAGGWPAADASAPLVMLSPEGALIALGRPDNGHLRVLRGILST